MPDPVVSVIIPVFESAEQLGAAIASAAEQTFGAIEIVMVLTPEFFQGDLKTEILRPRDSVRHFVSGPNTTPGGLLRIGTGAARGRFITWLKPDDLFDPRKIESQMKAIADSGCACVTCGSRRHMEESPPSVPSMQSKAATLRSLLDGSRDPATLLIARDCLEAIGGFDPTYAHLYELELAIRLAMRQSIAHVPATLVRWNSDRMNQADGAEEFRRIANGVLDEAHEAGILDGLEAIAEIVSGLGRREAPPPAAVQRHVARMVGRSDLAIGVLPGPDAADLISRNIPEALGAPHAGAFVVSRTANPADAILKALAASSSDRIVLIDPADMPAPEAFAMQLLHSAATGLDACLPGPDPLVYTRGSVATVIPGALFKRSALEKTPVKSMRTEAQFWAALSSVGRIGAMPPSRPIPRPDPRFVSGHPRFEPPRITAEDLVVALIDRDWYLAANPEIAALNVDPADHFLDVGWRQQRQPNPWFHTAWYLAQNPGVPQDMNPLEHFVIQGGAAGLRPSPGFDIEWYSRHYLDSDGPCPEALLHFMTVGLSIGALPYPRLRQAGIREEQDSPQPQSASLDNRSSQSIVEDDQLLESLVDGDWYRVAHALGPSPLLNAAAHYVEQGWRQGFNPNPWFDTRWYLSQNEDALEYAHPLTHFIRIGASRARKPCAFFDIAWYARHYLAGVEPSAEVLRHFLTIGLMSGAVPHPRIATPAVTKRLLRTPVHARSALIKRLLNILAQALASGEILGYSDVDLWPLLLAEDFPPDVMAVLLICEDSGGGFARARAAAGVLPLNEFAIFGVTDGKRALRVASRLEEDGISVKFSVPEQDVMLKDLLIELNCHRAAAVEPHLLDAPISRMIRNVGVPVFTNGPARRSN
jgi:hypothetical protein